MISKNNIIKDGLKVSISKLNKLYKLKVFDLADSLLKNLVEQYPENKEILELSIILLINKKKYIFKNGYTNTSYKSICYNKLCYVSTSPYCYCLLVT